MKERPILFSAPLVRAILAGRKTQTRRVVRNPAKPSPGHSWAECLCAEIDPSDVPCMRCSAIANGTAPYGVPGDRLWVRETWCRASDWYPAAPFAWRADYGHAWEWRDHVRGCTFERDGRKSFDCMACGFKGWKSPRFMPRAASRITLDVTSVRVERLNDISEDDAQAEGLALDGLIKPGHRRAIFANLWDGINGKRAPWASNPWVWVVVFQRVIATPAASPASDEEHG